MSYHHPKSAVSPKVTENVHVREKVKQLTSAYCWDKAPRGSLETSIAISRMAFFIRRLSLIKRSKSRTGGGSLELDPKVISLLARKHSGQLEA